MWLYFSKHSILVDLRGAVIQKATKPSFVEDDEFSGGEDIPKAIEYIHVATTAGFLVVEFTKPEDLNAMFHRIAGGIAAEEKFLDVRKEGLQCSGVRAGQHESAPDLGGVLEVRIVNDEADPVPVRDINYE